MAADPCQIAIVPKTLTLKHHQHQQLISPLGSQSSWSLNSKMTSSSSALALSPTKADKHTHLHLQQHQHHHANQQQPFELTIRVQVNLPFNQKTTVRVKPSIALGELFAAVCAESHLDSAKYMMMVVANGVSVVVRHDRLSTEPFDSFDTKEVTLVPLHTTATSELRYPRRVHFVAL